MRRANLADVVVDDLVEVEFHIWPAAGHRYAVVPSGDQETGTGVEVADHPNRAGASCPHRLLAREKVAIVRWAISLPTVPTVQPRLPPRCAPRSTNLLFRVPHPF